MITNFHVQQICMSNEKLDQELAKLRDTNPGSGETTIHLHAYRMLLEELRAARR